MVAEVVAMAFGPLLMSLEAEEELLVLVAVASMAVIAEDDHLEEEGEELTSMQDEAAYFVVLTIVAVATYSVVLKIPAVASVSSLDQLVMTSLSLVVVLEPVPLMRVQKMGVVQAVRCSC